MIRSLFAALALFAAATTSALAAPDCTADERVALSAYRALAEEHLSGILASERAIAATTDAQGANWARIKPALASLARDVTTEAAVWYAMPDGRYYTVDGDQNKESLKDRAYFPTLLAGKPVNGALVISKSTGHRSIIVATPVVNDGKVVAVIGVSVRARLLAAMIAEKTRMPDNLIFYALDADGRTAIHKDPERMFEFPSDMGDPSLGAAVNTILKAPAGSVTYEFRGTKRTALFETSGTLGWNFVLAREVH